jgi:uncharacterized protein YndB with AHSA1/START domain
MAAVDESKVTVVVRRTINAPVAAVYRVWTDPELAQRWNWGRNYVTVSIELDCRVGGVWRQQVRDRTNGTNWFFTGEFREIVPHKTLVHTFHFKSDRGDDEEPSLVQIDFRDLGQQTEVVITQTQLQADKKKATEEGWIDCCECIESVASDPKKR